MEDLESDLDEATIRSIIEEKPMNIRDIVKKYLIDNHYDGLAGEECGCETDDLICCDAPGLTCEPGHKMFCSACLNVDCEFRREGGHCVRKG